VEDANGCTPLMEAAADTEMLRVLIEAGAIVDRRDQDGANALFHCCMTDYGPREERRQMIAVLLSAGSSTDVRTAQHGNLLLGLQGLGMPELFRRLLDEGLDPNVRNQHGFSALHHACLHDAEADIVALLACGADPEARDANGRTPASYFLRGARSRHLLPPSPRPSAHARDTFKRSRLMLACKERLLDELRRCLDEGDDAGLADAHGKTALHHLLDARDLDEPVPEMLALLLGRPEVDVNATTKTGMTALHFAARITFAAPNITRTLLEHGADPTLRATNGTCPVDRVPVTSPDVKVLLEAWPAARRGPRR
jgi:ankyrin repeat protein